MGLVRFRLWGHRRRGIGPSIRRLVILFEAMLRTHVPGLIFSLGGVTRGDRLVLG